MEDAMDVGLKPRTRHQYSDVVVRPDVSKVEKGEGKSSENSTYLDIKGAFEDLDMHKILNVVQNNAKYEEEEREIAKAGGKEGISTSKSTRRQDVEEEELVEEEVVELEFEKAIPKLNTHTTMHCPNCNHQITKVILRRKIKRPATPREEPHEPLDLLGCFSCFSLFTSADNGRFNPFPIFWNKPDSIAPAAADKNVSREDGRCFSIFRVFRTQKDPEPPKPEKVEQEPEQPKPETFDPSSEPTKPENIGHPPLSTLGDIKYNITGKRPITSDGTNVGSSNPEDQLPASHPGEQLGVKHETSIDIPPQTSDAVQGGQRRPVGQDSTSYEILKSVVYGGLMEVIASLSVVASAAAGDASTLSIIALALANLIGGVIVVCHNLWDLRDDCFKYYSSQQTSDQEARNKYKELLGRVEHFPMHLFFAVLSFLVFGIIPPLAYGYSFHETEDKDFTMAVVAIASLVSVGLLAIFKAYIDRCNDFTGYFKTISYYLTTAVAVSGVSYIAGNLAMRLIEKLGLFESTDSGITMPLLPKVVKANPSLAYY